MPTSRWTLLLATLLLLLVCLTFTEGVPSQVRGVSLSKLVRQGRPTLSVSWTAPQSDVTVSEYQVQYRRSGTTVWGDQVNIVHPTTSTHLPGLNAGTEYDVRVRARSDAGVGEWSEVQTEGTFNIPSRVTGVSLTKTEASGTQALMVTWATPHSDLTISQYQVQYRRSEATSWNNATAITGSPPANSTILTGLDAGTVYNIRVRAVSELGAGEWSVVQTGITAETPSRVSGVTLTKTVESQAPALRVSWTPPQSDVAISQYQVEYKRSETTSWNNATALSVSYLVLFATLIGLDAGTEYTVRVRAVSAVGHGNWSVEYTGRTFCIGTCTDAVIDSDVSGTDNSLWQNAIIAAVCACQLEVVLVTIVTGLVVHFVTKRAVQQKPNSSQDGSGSTAEPTGLKMKGDNTYESVGGVNETGENVEMQSSPAYQAAPVYL